MTIAVPDWRDLLHPAWEYFQRPGNGVGGSLHAVLEDGSVEDRDVASCIERADAVGDVEGAALGRMLLAASRTQRNKLWSRYHLYCEGAPDPRPALEAAKAAAAVCSACGDGQPRDRDQHLSTDEGGGISRACEAWERVWKPFEQGAKAERRIP